MQVQLEITPQFIRRYQLIGYLKLVIFFFWRVMLFFVAIALASIAGGLISLYFLLNDLPSVDSLKLYDPNIRTEIIGQNGQVLAKIFDEENRKIISVNELPSFVKNAVIAIEDGRFQAHPGLDVIGILRAAKSNWENQGIVQGGSTITQQVTKNLFFIPEKTLSRKIGEALLATSIEKKYSKSQILELYLNQIYWGHNSYGIEAASETYFGKSASQLKLHEAAMLAGLIRGPEIYSPHFNYKMTKRRQSLVLDRMAALGYCSAEQARKAKKEPLLIYDIDRRSKHPYFTSYVMDILRKKFTKKELEVGGFKVYTTMDVVAQSTAEKILVEEIEKLNPYNVQQGALVSLDPKTGYVKAMVGGVNYSKSEFNRAFQAERQTGSSFKPFIYLTAFSKGYTPQQIEYDTPVAYKDGKSFWRPQNYGRRFRGAITLQSALERSVNVVAVKLMEKVGIHNVIQTTRDLGIKSEIRPYLSSALGASEITPLEMASAYGVFATGGQHFEATPILKIVDKYGKVVLDNTRRKSRQAYDKNSVNILNQVLQGVVKRGTGRAAQIPNRHIAGKTGTTSSHRDAWFVGYTPNLVSVVWVGNDQPTPMKHATGGGFCAPIWKKYMEKVLIQYPAESFQTPEKKEKPKPKRRRVYYNDWWGW